MAKKNVKNTEAEVIEAEVVLQDIPETEEAPAAPTLPRFLDVIKPADEERQLILITATPNKYKAMYWDYITVPAGADPREVIKSATSNKFINLVDARHIRQFVETNTPIRGMASTFADFATRYAKTFNTEVPDRVALFAEYMAEVLKQVDAGVTSGVWGNPETEEPAEAPATEAPEVDDPYEVVEAE